MSFFISTAGCSSEQEKLSMSDNGKSVIVKVGDQIVIELEGNPSTGYTWEAKDLDNSLLEKVGETEFKSNDPGLVGAGGELTLTYKTLKTGKTSLNLVYHRPWEMDIEPQRTYMVTIIIK
jgi:inhibitor of cysteine peptidase